MSARHRAPDGAAQPWAAQEAIARAAADGSAAAVQRVIARAYQEIGATRGARDRGAVARVIEALAMPGTDSLSDPAVGAALGRVGVDDLRRDPAGERTIALLMLECELTLWIDQGKADLDALADALTAYLVACNRASPGLDGRDRIVAAVREYLERRRLGHQNQTSVPVHQLSEVQRTAWEELAARIPWLHWLGHEAHRPRAPAEVSAAGLVDLLVLLRLRQQRRYGTDAMESVPLPERFLRLYAVSELDEADGFTSLRASVFAGPSDGSESLLARHALALDPLLHEPGRTARLMQSLPLPPVLQEAAEARIAVELSHVEAPEHLLVVRVDDAAWSRVLAVNLSASYPLSLRVGGQSLRLPPNAVEQPDAADYCSQPVPVQAGDRIEIGGQLLSLDVPMTDLAESGNITSSTIPSELFRGREEQLDRLRHGLGGRGPFTGRLIFGPRRAGKSTLMEQAALDHRLRGAVSIDVGNTTTGVRDFAGWSREVSRDLVRVVRKRLPGVTLEPGDNFIETLKDLDDALAGGAPVALCLDEFDALLLPEQEAGGRRAAARLGNTVFENLLVMGTVQRFHRSIYEFKNWTMVECPADLSWADGVTYFMGPLSDQAPGPRVEWLTRPAVAPHVFVAEIAPMIGLRPYFWAQLRAGLESVFRADLRQSRLAGPDLVRQELARVLTHDPYLRSVTESASALGYLEPEELQRKDLFSAAEQAVLVLFARLPAGQDAVTAEAAVAAGGEDAIGELIDRAFLTWHAGGTRLRCAVPIFLASLRTQARPLGALTARAARPTSKPVPVTETPATAAKPPAAPAKATPAAKPKPAVKQAPAAPPAPAKSKAKPAQAKPDAKPVQPTAPTAARQPAPASAPTARSKATPPAALVAAAAAAEPPGAAPGQPRLPNGVTMGDIEAVRRAVRDYMPALHRLSLADLGNLIPKVAPAVRKTNYAGTKKLTEFIDAFLPEYEIRKAGTDQEHLALPGWPAVVPAPKTAAPAKAAPAPKLAAKAAPAKAAPAKAVPAKAVPAKAVPAKPASVDKPAAAARPAAAPQEPAAPARSTGTPAAAPRKAEPPTPAQDAADIARVREALLRRLAKSEVLTFAAVADLIMGVAPRLRRSGTWAGEPTLLQFFEIYFKDFRIDGPSHKRYIRAPEQSSAGRRIRRLFFR